MYRFTLPRDIYLGKDGIIDNLNSAITAITNYKGATRLQGDIIFNGDFSWIKIYRKTKIII